MAKRYGRNQRRAHRDRIAVLERDNALLARDCDDLWRDLRDAERLAWEKARRQFEDRTAHLQAHNEHLLKQLVDLANLTPRPMMLAVPPK